MRNASSGLQYYCVTYTFKCECSDNINVDMLEHTLIEGFNSKLINYIGKEILCKVGLRFKKFNYGLRVKLRIYFELPESNDLIDNLEGILTEVITNTGLVKNVIVTVNKKTFVYVLDNLGENKKQHIVKHIN